MISKTATSLPTIINPEKWSGPRSLSVEVREKPSSIYSAETDNWFGYKVDSTTLHVRGEKNIVGALGVSFDLSYEFLECHTTDPSTSNQCHRIGSKHE